ncbi:MAG: signal peptidase I [Parcubacteria group bacterium RIFCSPHIGHO2_01_FULL_56_18]|nr:MAG: signal peptidase I [Parcubacteria group bacterium RIFCSPHIGHO2_01_FULL_56_18]
MTDPVMQGNTSPETQREGAQTSPSAFASYVMLALGLALFIRFFIAAPYVVSGASMEPTFDNWDYLITDRLSYRLTEPERGDVVVFCLPGTGECSLVERLKNRELAAPRTLIKRVIGLPGETVSVSDEGIRIVSTEHPEGFVLDEPYLSAGNRGGPTGMTTTLSAGEYFVMGDNRRVSSDSRIWGTLPKEDIIGHVLVRLFPLTTLGVLPGDASYSEKTQSNAQDSGQTQ